MADIVHSDYIDSVTGKLLHKFIRLLMRRETAGHTALCADETDFIALTVHKMIALRRNEARLACRTVIHAGPSAHIGYIVRCIMRRLEREHRSKTSGGLNLLQNIGTWLSADVHAAEDCSKRDEYPNRPYRRCRLICVFISQSCK